MVSLFGRGFDSLQLHKTHCNGGEFFVFNPLQTLSTPIKSAPIWGWNGSFRGIYEVKLENCVAMDFYEIGVFGSEKRGVEVVFYGFNTPKSLQRMLQSGVVVGRIGCLTQLRFRDIFARRKQKKRRNKKKRDVDIFPYKVGFAPPYSFYYQYVTPIGVSFHCQYI